MQRDPALSTRSAQPADPPQIIGESPAMRELLDLAQRAASSHASILLQGESGVGKRRMARWLHACSPRHEGEFVAVDCSQPESLLERLLFGAPIAETPGNASEFCQLDRARGGTLFLSEVHATPLSIQSRLWEFVQDSSEHSADAGDRQLPVRLIAASHRDLLVEVADGRFREDLFWLLNVIPVHVPPLRRRREDIAPLANHFFGNAARANIRDISKITDDALEALQQYGWPGNVRELQNYIERAVVLADGHEITAALLPGVVSGQQKSEMGAFRGADPKSLIEEFVHNEVASSNGAGKDLHARIVNPVERELIVQVMQLCNNVQKKAADRLGMNRNTLHKKLKEYGIE